MINLPKVTDLDVAGKRVLVRADLEYTDQASPRGQATDAIVAFLKQQKAAKIKLIGHKGLPEMAGWWKGVEVVYDLRADPGEEANAPQFARQLSQGWDAYVNEAFAVSHREHASIVGLPRLLPHAAGLRFIQEVENLSRVFDPSTGSGPRRPVVFIVGGVKKDKLDYLESLKDVADKILVGGRLPAYAEMLNAKTQMLNSNKIFFASLIADKEDLTINSIEVFEEEIAKAGTIVLAGPMGKYEEEGHRQGTERIFKAVVANEKAFKVVGGGDTEKAVNSLSLSLSNFDWVSVGGGAMLEFLVKKTLPGIEALKV